MALLTISEYAARYQAPSADVVVLDVRWTLSGGSGTADYMSGHLPGAVFVDFDVDICGPPGDGGRHPLPTPAALEASLRRAGISDGSSVVIYDSGDLMAASRTWWTLRWAGLSDVRVLDGGYTAAVAAGLGGDTTPVTPSAGTVTVRPGHMPVLDADGAKALAETGALYDVRTAARFRGDDGVIDPVRGHIPGAVSMPGEHVLAEGGVGFRPPGQLGDQFSDISTGDSGVYCGSGVTAARTALAATVAGLDTPAIYIGSWSDWIGDESRPVATGNADSD